VPSFIQQISEVIDVVRDNPHAALVQPSSDAKSEGIVEDEIDCGCVEVASSINISPPCCSSPSNLQTETKPSISQEVEW